MELRKGFSIIKGSVKDTDSLQTSDEFGSVGIWDKYITELGDRPLWAYL